MKHLKKHFLLLILFSFFHFTLSAQQKSTLLLEQPDMNKSHITFVHGGDIWLVRVGEKQALRITSTAAVESDPHISPDGKSIAFTSNRTGDASVYICKYRRRQSHTFNISSFRFAC